MNQSDCLHPNPETAGVGPIAVAEKRALHGWRLLQLASASLVLLLASGFVSETRAMSIRELRALEKSDSKQGANYLRYYLVGLMEGTLDAHAQGVRLGAKPQICLQGRRLEPRMAQELLETELKRNADTYEADMPVSLVMAQALATVYAC